MSAPRLEACYFDGPRSAGIFRRMARVLEASALQHCPMWSVRVREIVPSAVSSALGIPSHTHNSQKLEEWARLIGGAPTDDRVLLIDSDTAILRPLEAVWDRDFDLAYTERPAGSPFPFNGGVIFVRVNDRTRAFMERWRAANAEMLAATDARHRVWRAQYGGINQASFGRLLEDGAGEDLALVTLPCAEWNCEDQTWQRYDPAVTRVLHLKGALRRSLFQRSPPTPEILRLMAVWQALEGQALASTASRAS